MNDEALTDAELDALEAIASAAVTGPWNSYLPSSCCSTFAAGPRWLPTAMLPQYVSSPAAAPTTKAATSRVPSVRRAGRRYRQLLEQKNAAYMSSLPTGICSVVVAGLDDD